MKKIGITLCLALVSGGAYAQHHHGGNETHDMNAAEVEFENHMIGEAFGHYIQLKDALVKSKTDEAKKAATALAAVLKKSGESKAATAAKNLSSYLSLKEQRKAFSVLSDEIIALVKANKLSEGQVAFCPMANANTGGFWYRPKRRSEIRTLAIKC